ncbi:hypothetical protein [Mesorhizobium sp.]|uniref:hypothetical protein n=1 Tax=Mesorhizobium sp. TaxID=1871066 RepID=UPI00257987EE|nr:hypothetical protein [Mesorhizobium sp.]
MELFSDCAEIDPDPGHQLPKLRLEQVFQSEKLRARIDGATLDAGVERHALADDHGAQEKRRDLDSKTKIASTVNAAARLGRPDSRESIHFISGWNRMPITMAQNIGCQTTPRTFASATVAPMANRIRMALGLRDNALAPP